MAEGGSIQTSCQGSLCKASGDAEEALCEPCFSMGKWVIAQGYCQICKEYICDNCLAVHKNQKITRGHTILDKKQMPPAEGSNTNQDHCFEVCNRHHLEIVRFYCQAHDETGCKDCMTLDHIRCKKIRIQDISNGFNATREFRSIQRNLDKSYKELENMKGSLDDTLKYMDTTHDIIQNQITYYRERINEYLDKIQDQLTDQVANLKKTYEIEMDKLIAEHESMTAELEDILQKIQNDKSMQSIFVIAKQTKKWLPTMERRIDKLEKSRQKLQQHHYVFRPSTEMDNLISAKSPLGKLQSIPYINTGITYLGTTTVKSTTDKKDCWISDCTLLGLDRVVVTDNFNKMIKLVDISNHAVISSYETSCRPTGITAVGTDQVAVTLPDETKIILLNVADTFTKLREIQVTYACRGVAYNDGKLAVTCVKPGHVEILDLQGNVLHTIRPKQDGADLLLRPFYTIFGRDKDTVIVSDESTNKVSLVTFNGQILCTYTHDALIQPSGLVMTADGVVFVCSWKNDSIRVIAPDFKTSSSIINNDINVAKPGTITYCDINHRLYVSNNVPDGKVLNNTIKLFDLNA